jgi:pimeloyl-ACP methyl ester carboxylesterase
MRAAAADELSSTIHYRTVTVDGLNIFNREAGPDDAPTIPLLHLFPMSSHMFRDLIPLLSDRYHLVAPDYAGFGNGSALNVHDNTNERARSSETFSDLRTRS